MSKYMPGACNIGKKEVRKRYAIAFLSFTLSALLIYLRIRFMETLWTLPLLPALLLVAFEGLYQGRLRFCVALAARRLYDLSGSDGERGRVESEEAHRRDMQEAKLIHAYSLLSAAIVMIVVLVIAHALLP